MSDTVVASSVNDMAGYPKPPLRRRRIIERPRLIRAIDRSRARIRMLIAGAGYGKTTLAEQWAAQDGRRVVWVRARRSSADVAVLVRQMAAAVGSIVPGSDLRLTERLDATADPADDIEVLVDLLAAGLATWPEDGWIVIDDYQYIRESATAEAFVDALVQQTPVNLLISSRERPNWISVRRVLYGEVLEIGQSLLAMSEEEVDQLLSGAHEELSSGLLALAGGWPAVVGLASIASQDTPLPTQSIDIPERLYAFFAEEVFRRLDSDSRVALGMLATAPALDRQLANDLLGVEVATRTCSDALAIGVLEEREGRLELHPLAAAFLQEQARREARDDFAQTVARCLDAYRARAEWDAAFELIERYGTDEQFMELLEDALDSLLDEGRLATLERLVARAVARGLSSSTIEVGKAQLALRAGKHLSAEMFAHAALTMADGKERDAWRAAMLAGRAAHAGSREESALDFYRVAERSAVTDRDRREAVIGQLSAASALEHEDTGALLATLDAGPDVPDPYVRIRIADKKLAAGLAFGGTAALPDAARVAELVDHVGDPFARCSFRSVYAYGLCLSALYAEALEQALKLHEDATQYRVDLALPYAHSIVAAALAGLGRFADALVALDQAGAEAKRCNDDFGLQNIYAIRVRVLAQQGRGTEACGLEPPDLRDAVRVLRGEVLASRSLALASVGRFDEAKEAASRAAESTRAVETRVLVPAALAICDLKQKHSSARKSVVDLLTVALDSGAVGLVVAAYRASPELLEALLTFDDTREQTVHICRRAGDEELVLAGGWDESSAFDPVETLSRREREVYDLMCEGLSNGEVAKKLFITEGTVKVHVQHVFDKLGIRSRTALAINAARERRLRGL